MGKKTFMPFLQQKYKLDHMLDSLQFFSYLTSSIYGLVVDFLSKTDAWIETQFFPLPFHYIETIAFNHYLDLTKKL